MVKPPEHVMLTDTIQLIWRDAWRMECLRAVASMRLPDWHIAAGFLRNAIWDAPHGKLSRTPLHDVDVVYYDPVDPGTAAEAHIEAVLYARLPNVKWEVKNQARMHGRNGYAPYRDSEHAIAHWIETPTCGGIRIEPNGRLRIVAPHDLGENWSLRVVRNPLVPPLPALFNDRVRQKRWIEDWPRLHVEWAREA
jgi:uncharacterized protein